MKTVLCLSLALFCASLFFDSIAFADAGAVLGKLKGYVAKTGHYSVGQLSVGAEASLQIGTGTPQDLIWRVIRVMGSVAATFAVLLYIAAGLFLVTAQDENQFNKGKTIATLTTIGIILVFAAYIIVQFVLALIFAI